MLGIFVKEIDSLSAVVRKLQEESMTLRLREEPRRVLFGIFR